MEFIKRERNVLDKQRQQEIQRRRESKRQNRKKKRDGGRETLKEAEGGSGQELPLPLFIFLSEEVCCTQTHLITVMNCILATNSLVLTRPNC